MSGLLGGNTVVRVGVIVLFFGVAFLLKYAYEHTHLPIEVRLIGVAAGAIAMLSLGWRLRRAAPAMRWPSRSAGSARCTSPCSPRRACSDCRPQAPPSFSCC